MAQANAATIEDLKELCRTLGCSGLTPDKCPGNPKCAIVRKVILERPDLLPEPTGDSDR
jgi:hypothetical protein